VVTFVICVWKEEIGNEKTHKVSEDSSC
jgi:hypothetical protein